MTSISILRLSFIAAMVVYGPKDLFLIEQIPSITIKTEWREFTPNETRLFEPYTTVVGMKRGLRIEFDWHHSPMVELAIFGRKQQSRASEL